MWGLGAKHALLFLFTTAAAVAAGDGAGPRQRLAHVAASALLSTQTNTALPGQVTKESESLDTDFSPSSNGSLGPASRRQVLLQNVPDCRPSSVQSQQQQEQDERLRQPGNMRQPWTWVSADKASWCEKFAPTSGHMREREGG